MGKTTLITLKSIRSILHVMGLMSSAVQVPIQNPINYWPNLLYSIPLLALLFPLVSYFYANIATLLEATDAFYVIAATLMCLGQYWFLVMQKFELNRLVLRLQHLVEQSKFCINFTEVLALIFRSIFLLARTTSGEKRPSFNMYRNVEMKISRFTTAMKAFVIFSSSICLFLPFAFASFHFLMGVYRPDDYYLPYKTM